MTVKMQHNTFPEHSKCSNNTEKDLNECFSMSLKVHSVLFVIQQKQNLSQCISLNS